jgi:hypothetical protein
MQNEQQEFLRKSMSVLGLTRKEFARCFDISPRSLDSWLLPPESDGFRKMNLGIQDRVYKHLRESEIIGKFNGNEATISGAVPVIRCDKFGFNFPSLYRIKYECDKMDMQTGEYTGEVGYFHGYALSATPYIVAANVRIFSAEPISRLDGDMDTGWVFIKEHRSLERADACAMYVYESQPEWVGSGLQFYTMESRIFSLHQIDTPSPFSKGMVNLSTGLGKKIGDIKDRLIIYNSDSYLKEIDRGILKIMAGDLVEDAWGIIIDQHGESVSDKFGEH